MRRIRRYAALLTFAITGGLVSGQIKATNETQNSSLEVGAGVAYVPDYSGAGASRTRLRVWADGRYQMDGYGTIALDSGSLTIAPELRWDLIDAPNAGIGVLIGYRAGRDDRNPSFASASDGSNRLHGLPDVSSTIDAGIAGHLVLLGVPIFAQVRSALSGTQGMLINLGIYLPVEPAPDFELTVLPTLTWANARQMRALYGVAPPSATASGFAPYDTGGAWENAAVEIGGDWRISAVWHLIASAAYQHLLGSAARSSIVQTANQSSALIGVAFHF